MSGPRVTVVTPTYNSEAFIDTTAESVMAQTEQDWEMIIVDDCSRDGTLHRLEALAARDERIKYRQLPENSGAAVARNTAIRQARGRYIAFLDADDLWRPDKLETQLAFMAETGTAFSFSSYDVIDENGMVTGHMPAPGRVTYRQLLRSNVIGCLTAMYDRETLGTVEMPLLRKRQDFGLWLRLLRKTDHARGVPKALSLYRVRPGSISYNKTSTLKYTWQLYTDVEKLSKYRAAYYLGSHLSRALLRRLRA